MNINYDTEAIRSVAETALSPGERLYWVGRPNPMRSMRSNLARPLFGLVWVGIVYFMFTKFGSFGSDFHLPTSSFSLIFQLVLVVFFFIGLRMLFSPIWNYFKAHFTVYALTDERALIINRLPRKTVRSYSARNFQKIERHGSDQEGDVIFGSERHTYTDHSRNNQGGINITFGDDGPDVNFGGNRTRTVIKPIGFFGISQPRKVENLLLDMIERASER
jgi:hypothetical protein